MNAPVVGFVIGVLLSMQQRQSQMRRQLPVSPTTSNSSSCLCCMDRQLPAMPTKASFERRRVTYLSARSLVNGSVGGRIGRATTISRREVDSGCATPRKLTADARPARGSLPVLHLHKAELQ